MKPSPIYGAVGDPSASSINETTNAHVDHNAEATNVVVILEELGLPYESSCLDELKKKPFTDINPNDTVPAIIDPNAGITLFECGAISPETFHLQQWAHFQAVGQGPYLRHAAWFCIFQPEPFPSARERGANEINSMASVLDCRLNNRSWLVGDKCTYADLAFVIWNALVPSILKDAKDPWNPARYPDFKRWQEAMQARDSVKHVMNLWREQEIKSSGRLQSN